MQNVASKPSHKYYIAREGHSVSYRNREVFSDDVVLCACLATDRFKTVNNTDKYR